MIDSPDFRKKRMPLKYGTGRVPVLGFGTLVPDDALDEIKRIQTRQRSNAVVKTGSPGFIPQGR